MCVAFGALLQSALVTPHRAVCRKSSGAQTKKVKDSPVNSLLTRKILERLCETEDDMFLLVCISCHRVPSLILIHMNTPDISLLVHLNRFPCSARKHGHKCNTSK